VMEIRLSENAKVTEAELDGMLQEIGYLELDKKEIK
jgi:hypothetical protein